MERSAPRHPFPRTPGAAGACETQHEARQYGRSIQQHGASAAFAQLTTVLRSCESQIFAQHFEQRLVWRERYFLALTIHLEGDSGHDVILRSRLGKASFLTMIKALLSATALLSIIPTCQLSAQDYRAQALRILRTVPLIDGHNDIPGAIRDRGGLDSVDLAVSQPKLMTDIARLRAGRVGGQFWAAYVPVTTMDSGPHPAVYALEQIDLVRRLCANNSGSMAMAHTAADVQRNFAAGKISCLIGIEGGHAIENSLGALRMFYDLGKRYITLKHWRSLDWAVASTDTARRGLSAFGKQVVLEMNRLGMLVDLSHVNDVTMSDALHTSRAPIIFSHSSARALTDHARDVPDSILKLVPANGGIVMVNFNPGFVSEAVRAYGDSTSAWARALRAAAFQQEVES